MTHLDVAVVGAGLFGNVIAQHLRSLGLRTLTIADDRLGKGSDPAACLMKPSWLSSIPNVDREAALQVLDKHYGVHDLQFEVRLTAGLPKGWSTVHWCDPAAILQRPDIRAKVYNLYESGDYHVVQVDPLCGGEPKFNIKADHVVLATGMWVEELLPSMKGRVEPRYGAAYLHPTAEMERPFIRPWAPYKQLVAFNRGDGLWVGDGTSLKHVTTDRLWQSWERCAEAVELPSTSFECLFGARPYAKLPKGTPCLLEREGKIIIATGGAKNGTLAAGWAAHKIGEMLS